jgi:hypothetical protein
MKSAKLYRRPNAQFICEDSIEAVLEVFNEVDPIERAKYFMRMDDRIFDARDIDKLQSKLGVN